MNIGKIQLVHFSIRKRKISHVILSLLRFVFTGSKVNGKPLFEAKQSEKKAIEPFFGTFWIRLIIARK